MKEKQFHFNFFRLLVQNKVKNVASYLVTAPSFWKSHGHFITVSFSIKPGDQTNETESPNLVNNNKSDRQDSKRWVPKLFFLSIRCSEKFQTEWVTNWSKTTEIKELQGGSFNFSAEVLPSQNVNLKSEIGIVKLKVK